MNIFSSQLLRIKTVLILAITGICLMPIQFTFADGDMCIVATGLQTDKLGNDLTGYTYPLGFYADGNSTSPTISSDGRYVVFESLATDLISGDTNGVSDIFLFDRQNQDTLRISVSSTGIESNGASSNPMISDDGSAIIYQSNATNLVTGDTNNKTDIFKYVIATQTTTRVSIRTNGNQGNNNSDKAYVNSNGRYIVFQSIASNLVGSDTNGVQDIFLRDTVGNTTSRISTSATGIQSNGISANPIIVNSRYIAFDSLGTNLVTGDTNGVKDVFLVDIIGLTIDRASINSTGVQGNGDSQKPIVSFNGASVIFESYASNLISGDTNGFRDLFLHNMINGITTIVSAPPIWMLQSGPNADSYGGKFSPDGYHIVLESNASNLVTGDTNGLADIFMYDVVGSAITRVSLSDTEQQNNGASFLPATSTGGQYTVFVSSGTNLINGAIVNYTNIFLRDSIGGNTELISKPYKGNLFTGMDQVSDHATISSDNRYILLETASSNLVPEGDYNNKADIYLYDRLLYTWEKVSTNMYGYDAGGSSSNPTMSADARYVAFRDGASDIVSGDTNGFQDVFVKDRVSGTIQRVNTDSSGNQADNAGNGPKITADGRYVAFGGPATNLVPNDTNGVKDIFVKDRQTGITTRVSVDSIGTQANGDSTSHELTSNGNYIVFFSYASNLVSNDTNGIGDVFVHDLINGNTTRVSVDSSGNQVTDGTLYDKPSISADGRYIVFATDSTMLAAGTTPGITNIFLHDTITNTTTAISSGFTTNSHDPILSDNGGYIIFTSDGVTPVCSDTKSANDIFVYAIETQKLSKVTMGYAGDEGDNNSSQPTISPDGTIIAYFSDATNLIPNNIISNANTFYANNPIRHQYGNGIIEPGEQCDDGNLTNGDGCSNTSMHETPTCSIATSPVTGEVGNSIITLGIAGSAGYFTTLDWGAGGGVQSVTHNNSLNENYIYAITGSYTITAGVSSSYTGNILTGLCTTTITITDPLSGGTGGSSTGYGNGIVESGEQCDDGNLTNGDGCNNVGIYETPTCNLTMLMTGTVGVMTPVLGLTSSAGYFTNIDRGIGGGAIGINGVALNTGYTYSSTGSYMVTAYVTSSYPGNSLVSQCTSNITMLPSIVGGSIQGFGGGDIVDKKSIIKDLIKTYGADKKITKEERQAIRQEIKNLNLMPSTNIQKVILENAPKIGFIGGDSTITLSNNGGGISFSQQGGSSLPSTNEVNPSSPQDKNQLKDAIIQNIQGLKNNQGSASIFTIAPVDLTRPEAPVVIIPMSKILTEASTISRAAPFFGATVANGDSALVPVIPSNSIDSQKRCFVPDEKVFVHVGANTKQKDLVIYMSFLRAYDLTKYDDTDDFRPFDGLLRYQAAKILVTFAKNVLCRQPVQSYNDQFTDIDNIDATLMPYIQEAYEYNILNGANGKFRPLDTITKQEFIVALMRILTNQNLDVQGQGGDRDIRYKELFAHLNLETDWGMGNTVERYDVARVLYKMYHYPTYTWTDGGYILPLDK